MSRTIHIQKIILAKFSGLWLLVFLFGTVKQSNAQQDPQYTMHMYNTQVVNPAYIGSIEAVNFGFLTRTQWVDFEGAPQTWRGFRESCSRGGGRSSGSNRSLNLSGSPNLKLF